VRVASDLFVYGLLRRDDNDATDSDAISFG
jgi:hypothetical protein